MEDVREGQRMNSKVPPQALNKFRGAKAIHVDPTHPVIVEAWQKFIHRLNTAFHDGVSIVLDQRNYGLLALILRRHYQRSRGSSGRRISQFVHRSVWLLRGPDTGGASPERRIQRRQQVTQPPEQSKR